MNETASVSLKIFKCRTFSTVYKWNRECVPKMPRINFNFISINFEPAPGLYTSTLAHKYALEYSNGSLKFSTIIHNYKQGNAQIFMCFYT